MQGDELQVDRTHSQRCLQCRAQVIIRGLALLCVRPELKPAAHGLPRITVAVAGRKLHKSPDTLSLLVVHLRR